MKINVAFGCGDYPTNECAMERVNYKEDEGREKEMRAKVSMRSLLGSSDYITMSRQSRAVFTGIMLLLEVVVLLRVKSSVLIHHSRECTTWMVM